MQVEKRLWLTAIVFLGAVLGGNTIAGVNTWTPEGPYGVSPNQIAVDPTQPDHLLLSTLNGLYRTTNAGVDWSVVRADFNGARVVYDPANPGRVYAAYGLIYRSDDGGQTFTVLTDVPGRPSSVSIAADGALYGVDATLALSRSDDLGQSWTVLPRPWPANRSAEFVLDPNDSAVIYAFLNDIGTFRSADRGATWTGPIAGSPGTTAGGTQSPRDVFWFTVQPGNSNRLLAATSRGILISNDAGTTWSDAAFVRFAYWIGFHPTQPQRAIAIGLHGEIMRSEDGGQTWPTSQDGADMRIYTVGRGAIDPTTPGRLWATSANGPIVSSDWGATFSVRIGALRMAEVVNFSVALDGTTFAALQSPIGIYRRDGVDWDPLDISTLFAPFSPGVNVRQFAIAPGNSSVLYAGNVDRVLARSSDGGLTWVVRSFDFPAPNAMPLALVVSPSNPDVVFASASNAGAWRSNDGGLSWTRVADLPVSVAAISFDVANPAVMYAGGGDDFPDTIFKSLDGGASWSRAGVLPFGGFPNSIVIDPVDSDVVYLTASSHLYKSTDAGASWLSIDMGGTPNQPLNSNLLLIDPVIPTTLFAAASPGVQTISRSVDGGATWEQIPFTGGGSYTTFYKAFLDPERPNRVIANPARLGLMSLEVSPDLEVSLTDFGAPLLVGDNVTLNAAVRNLGPFASSASEVRISLPAWLTPTVPSNCSWSVNTLVCRIGALRVDEAASIAIPLAVDAAPANGTVVATVEGHETDSNASNDQVTVSASSARYADLQMQITPLAIAIGRTTSTRLTARVQNAGPSAAVATQVVVDMPAGLTLVTATPSVGTCSVAGATITCMPGDLANDAVVTIDLDVIGAARGAQSVTGYATADALDTNGTPGVLATVNVAAYGDARVQVTESAGGKFAGTAFTYAVLVRNDGPDAMNLTGSLTLTGATVTAASAEAGGACIFTTSRAECSFTAFPVGGQATMTVTVNASAAGSVTASGLVSVNAIDPVATNNTAAMVTTVAAPPPPPAPPSSGGDKGGGGRLDWLLMCALAVILIARCARSWKGCGRR
jgi:photosystem II stability/assembly factor-like uncharacterized protein